MGQICSEKDVSYVNEKKIPKKIQNDMHNPPNGLYPD